MAFVFKEISQYAFENIQREAGVLLKDFDITNPTPITDDMIVTATNGGFNIVVSDEFTDFGEDVDNVPADLMELKELTKRTVTASTEAYELTPKVVALALGAADTSGSPVYVKTTDNSVTTGKTYYTRTASGSTITYTAVETPTAESLSTYYEKIDTSGIVTPRSDIQLSDFKSLTWLGRVGKSKDWKVAVVLDNCLSTGGFSFQSTKNGKGRFPLTFTAHRTMKDPDKVPFKFYKIEIVED